MGCRVYLHGVLKPLPFLPSPSRIYGEIENEKSENSIRDRYARTMCDVEDSASSSSEAFVRVQFLASHVVGAQKTLHWGCGHGTLHVAHWVRVAFADDWAALTSLCDAQKALFVKACRRGHLPTAQWLLAVTLGRHPDRTRILKTGFRAACDRSSVDVVQWLLDTGHLSKKTLVALARAMLDDDEGFAEFRLPMAQWLVGALNVPPSVDMLRAACVSGGCDRSCAAWILGQKPQLRVQCRPHAEPWLMRCARAGDLPMVQWIVDVLGQSPPEDTIVKAAKSGSLPLVQWLLSVRRCGWSRGHECARAAVRKSHFHVFDWAAHTFGIRLDLGPVAASDLVLEAVKAGRMDLLRGLPPNALSAAKTTAILKCALSHARREVVTWLVEDVSNPAELVAFARACRVTYGELLAKACDAGDVEFAAWVLSVFRPAQPPDADMMRQFWTVALHSAVMCRTWPMARFLVGIRGGHVHAGAGSTLPRTVDADMARLQLEDWYGTNGARHAWAGAVARGIQRKCRSVAA